VKRITTVTLFLILSAAALAAAGFYYHSARPVAVPEQAAAPQASATSSFIYAETATSTPVAIHPEMRQAETVPYFPPPSINLSGGKLGNQRVPGTESIGDIHKTVYHLPSLTLFMTVVEPDRTKSVWRLDQHGRVERIFTVSLIAGEIDIHIDSQGVIYVQHDNPVTTYRSADAGANWVKVAVQDPGMFWAIADDGKGTLYGALHDWNRAILYRSPNNGFGWEPWKDFQKIFPEEAVTYRPNDDRFRLRHLHDVIYDQADGVLMVGTGDITRWALRSDDGGETWRQFWDEGFTAHAKVGGGNRYLLGPDQLHGHGIVLYDVRYNEAQEVWNPIKHGYAGYVYSIANIGGTYYAAVHTEANEVAAVVPKFGIIASPDGVKWYPFMEWGPLGNHARTDVRITEAPNVIYAVVNGSLYAFRPLTRDWFLNQKAF
jgi:hypothetical protein